MCSFLCVYFHKKMKLKKIDLFQELKNDSFTVLKCSDVIEVAIQLTLLTRQSLISSEWLLLGHGPSC